MISRADRSPVAEWWWTVDRTLLAALLLLLLAGILLSLSASPPVAEDLGLSAAHFTVRHVVFALMAAGVMIGVSFLSPRQVRHLALLVFLGALVATIATLFVGMEAKGARRWLYLGGFSLQPAEFVKPAFVVLVAFLFAEGSRRPEVPGQLLAIFLAAMVIAPLVAQPDFGQAMLIAIVWGALFFLAGMAWRWVIALGLAGLGGLVAAYHYFPHVAGRIDRFLDPSSGDTYQVDMAIASFVRGGWFGAGRARAASSASCRTRTRTSSSPSRRRSSASSPAGRSSSSSPSSCCAGSSTPRASATSSPVWRSRGSWSCSACRRRSTWASTCTSCRRRA